MKYYVEIRDVTFGLKISQSGQVYREENWDIKDIGVFLIRVDL